MQLGLRPGELAWAARTHSQRPERDTDKLTCKCTHTYSCSIGRQDPGLWGQSPQGPSFRSSRPKGQVCSNLPPLSDSTQPGGSSYQAPASKKVCIMGLSLLQIQLNSASSRKPSLTISPNWSISCLPCRKPNQGTLKGAEILPSYLPDG